MVSCSSAEKKDSISETSIDPAAIEALTAYDKDFKIYHRRDFIKSVRSYSKSNPAIATGDFNGDKTPDYAVMGQNLTHEFLLTVVSKDKTFRVFKIDKARKRKNKKFIITEKGKEFGNWHYLTRVGKQVLKSEYESNKIKLKTGAFRVEYYGKGSVIYFLTRRGFRKFVSSD